MIRLFCFIHMWFNMQLGVKMNPHVGARNFKATLGLATGVYREIFGNGGLNF